MSICKFVLRFIYLLCMSLDAMNLRGIVMMESILSFGSSTILPFKQVQKVAPLFALNFHTFKIAHFHTKTDHCAKCDALVCPTNNHKICRNCGLQVRAYLNLVCKRLIIIAEKILMGKVTPPRFLPWHRGEKSSFITLSRNH